MIAEPPFLISWGTTCLMIKSQSLMIQAPFLIAKSQCLTLKLNPHCLIVRLPCLIAESPRGRSHVFAARCQQQFIRAGESGWRRRFCRLKWPFQDPKLEVSPIFWASKEGSFSGIQALKIFFYMVYLHFRILKLWFDKRVIGIYWEYTLISFHKVYHQEHVFCWLLVPGLYIIWISWETMLFE